MGCLMPHGLPLIGCPSWVPLMPHGVPHWVPLPSRAGENTTLSELSWGKQRLCDTRELLKQLEAADRACNSCLDGADICAQPPRVLFHTYLEGLHPDNWQANLLSIQVRARGAGSEAAGRHRQPVRRRPAAPGGPAGARAALPAHSSCGRPALRRRTC
jgi:hypothetical protein